MSATAPEHDARAFGAASEDALHVSGQFDGLGEALRQVDRTLCVYRNNSTKLGMGLADEGDGTLEAALGEKPVVLPPCLPSDLGDPSFRADHGLKYSYYAGSMANGIATEALVEALGRAGMLGFFGAAGLSPARIEEALQRLTKSMAGLPYGFNLINTPQESLWQEQVASLYIKYDIRLVEASAYLALSLALVRYRTHGIHRGEDGRIIAPNRVIAKVSRAEVAQRFFAPPPARMLKKLVKNGDLTEEQAEMAAYIPMAQDLTAEADSGGHTDHRSALALLPSLLRLRDEMQAKYDFDVPLRVGLGGGVSTPGSAAAVFAMGAAYVVTGSVNQGSVEAGSCELVKAMLAEAAETDVAVAPAADMFEMGVTVQVLKKGTRFAERAGKLYDLYKSYNDLDALPAEERKKLEEVQFRAPLEEVWAETRAFFLERDPSQVKRAEANPRHKMALVFRSYLGQSSNWALHGVKGREEDYQIWCGPAMGAFNVWTNGTFLAEPANRHVTTIALNTLYGAAVLLRVNSLRLQGVPVPPKDSHFAPMTDEELEACLP